MISAAKRYNYKRFPLYQIAATEIQFIWKQHKQRAHFESNITKIVCIMIIMIIMIMMMMIIMMVNKYKYNCRDITMHG